MKEYRCYFLNRRGGIGDVVEFVSPSDGDAQRLAREHFGRQSDYPGFEIWEKARLVFREASEVARG
ncbi:MAG TPA: hypothetical protein VKV32_06520 [Stellaceae bacterium]|nr:hypothetical protein [Stellaceae bacterium]